MSKILDIGNNEAFKKSFVKNENNDIPETKFINKDDSLKVMFKPDKKLPEEEIIIPMFKPSPRYLINKGIILYGPTESGKSTIFREFAFLTKDYFPIVFAFAPTNAETHSYDRIIPAPLVFEDITLKQIGEIYTRQKMAAEIYNNANNLNTLNSLFLKVANAKSKMFLEKLLYYKSKAIKEVEEQYESPIEQKQKKDEIEEIFKEKLIKFYKQIINPSFKKFQTMQITQEEKFALKYRDLNPNILIIFDDALTEIMKLLKDSKKEGNEIIKNFFFKGRHCKISHWYGFQDDSRLDSEIRKNAHISIFTSKAVALAFFSRAANNFSKAEIKKAEAIIDVIFSNNAPNFAKLVYSRLDPKYKFYYIVAKEYSDDEIQMCSQLVRNFCKKISIKNGSFDTSNPYYLKFANNMF